MLRYAVSGHTASPPLTATTSTHTGDDTTLRLAQLRARLSSSTPLPSSAPVEVVWNANDAAPFHHVTPASPEDVALCTEYLVRQSWAAAQSSPPPLPSAVAAATAASLPVDDTVKDLLQTVAALRSVLQAHRSLLAGAESLQTGQPLSFLLRQLAEADAYLEWSLDISESVSAALKRASAASAECVRAEEEVGEEKDEGADAAAAEEEAQRRRALRGDFEREVCCLRHQLSRCVLSPPRQSAMTSSPVSATAAHPLDTGNTDAWADRTVPTSPIRPPLFTVVTSTHNSLASALKAAAVTWTATRRGPSEKRYHPHHDHHCYSSPILWHPAAETALSAVWLMVLLRGCLTCATPVQDQQQQQQSASTPATVPLVQGSQKERRSEERGAKREQPSAPLFHILLTGGDTSVHFVAPWAAGVQKACATLSDPCSIRAKDGQAKTCSSSSSNSSASLLGQQQTAETSHLPEPLLLCYGCPDTQVGDLCAALGRLPYGARHPFGGSESGAAGGGYSVVELRTEMPTTGLLLPVASVITDEPTASSAAAVALAGEGVAPAGQTVLPVTAASSLTLLQTYASSSTAVPREGCVIAAVLSTLEAVAQHVFDGSVLEPPFLRRQPAAVCPSSPSFRVGPALGATPSSTSLPLFSPAHSCMSVPGWCSLYFVDEVHAPTLLRLLVLQHWKEPLYMGHSLLPSSRRGPLPSQAHTQQLQAALKLATRGSRGPEKETGVIADAEEGALGLLWQQVCGGFALPLTALAGRGSPYLLPCLLVSDLTSAMSAGELQELAAHLSYYNPMAPSRVGKAEEGRHRDVANRQVTRAAQHAVVVTQRRLHAFLQHFDSAGRGYRGVVGGNVLCICRYPAPLAAAVKVAVMTGEGVERTTATRGE